MSPYITSPSGLLAALCLFAPSIATPTADTLCFPTPVELAQFNASVNGNLFEPAPYGQVCYAGHFDAAACSTLVLNKNTAQFRETIPAAMMFTNNEFDQNDAGCPVPFSVITTPLTGECVLGALGTYFVNATTPADISKSVVFAAKHKLRLRIKNTGHDYTGRSTAPDAFIIRTSNLKSINLIPNFTPTGCSVSSSQSVMALGAGVVSSELYAESEKLGVVTTGGYSSSVGVAGGFSLGGGAAGPFQPLFGMGADNVVQFDVVTANGTITVANACQNPDLFWAMRGGGGVFAITTKTYIKAHPAFQAVNVVVGQITASSVTAYNQLINQFVEQDPNYMKNFSAGIWESSFPTVALAFHKGFQAGEKVVSSNISLAAFDFLHSIPGLSINVVGLQFPTWNSAYQAAVRPLIDAGNVVGINLVLVSRIISKGLLGSETGRQSIANFVTGLPQGQPFILQRVAGGAVSNFSTSATSVNPAWRSALAYMDVPIFDTTGANGVTALQNSTVDNITATANKIFGVDAYYNEDNKREPDFQKRFWGANYPRLLALKQKFDPNCVLTGSLTVGQVEICHEA